MPQIATVADLIRKARQRADAETPTPDVDFVTDTELRDQLADGYAELLELIADSSEGGLVQLGRWAVIGPIAPGVFNLPDDCMRLFALDVPISGRWVPAKQLNFAERDQHEHGRHWHQVGDTVIFFQNVGAQLYDRVRVWYLPTLPASGAELPAELAVFGGWQDFLTAHVAAHIAVKENMDETPHLRVKSAAMERVRRACMNLIGADVRTIAETEFQYEDLIGRIRWS